MIEFNELRIYLNNKPEVEECFPFGDNVYVYKLQGKMFALMHRFQNREIISFKLVPEEGFFKRDLYNDFIAGYHLNKEHWNTIFLDGDVPVDEAEICIDKSYYLIYKKLTKKQKKYLLSRYSEKELKNNLDID